MTTAAYSRPDKSEYPVYCEGYVSRVPAGDIVEILGSQLEDSLALFRSIPEARGGYRYAEGKWSVKEVIGHIIDSERIFAYRALRFSRGDGTPLAGFEQDDYVRGGAFDKRSLKDLIDEFEHVRRATISLFSSLDGEAWSRRGSANKNEMSVRALAFVLAGHERHHVEILRTRYLR
jgi:DinB superfamily